MSERKETCATCRFWLRNEDARLGECRRRAPAPATVDTETHDSPPNAWWAYWPVVEETDFCGEWAPPPIGRPAG